jgi:hypothetical protein
MVLALALWNRLTFDVWLARYDVVTYYLPWYAEVGQRLRELDVPAWNPHQFSGTPLAADPQSGWGYVVVMAAFALLPPLAAYKAVAVVQLAVAALSTYWLGRTLRLGSAASLVAATVYATGPFLQWDTACCLPFAQLGTWLPLGLAGVEVAFRADGWRELVAPLIAAAFAVSQMLAGWVGEGWIYTVLIVGTWAAYRCLTGPSSHGRCLVRRLTDGAIVGAAALAGGAAIGAAGVLPRLAHNAETNLADGDYERLGVRGLGNAPWDVGYLATQLSGMGLGYHHRAVGLGGAVIVLGLVGIVVGRRGAAVPYFALLTTAVLVLSLDWTPLHWLLYRIPRYEAIHEHDPWRILALLAIGPSILAGAGVDAIPTTRIRRYLAPLLLVPFGLVLLVALTSGELDGVIGWSTLAAAGVATMIVLALPSRGRTDGERRRSSRTASLAIGAVVVTLVAQPLGLEVLGSEIGWPGDPRWEQTWDPDHALEPALAIEVQTTDPGGVGEFLARRQADDGPFRYVGYAGVGYPDGGRGGQTYMIRRFQPGVQAVLVNGRPIFLGLEDVQGYNPIQYRRYVELFEAINGAQQGYHTAFVLASGTGSPLLDLLDVRYVVVDLSLPLDRDDAVALRAGRHEVFRTSSAVVYETTRPVSRAWIVHDLRSTERGLTLASMTRPGFDARLTAYVEGPLPATGTPPAGTVERAEVRATTPESLTVDVEAAAPGLLVLSQVYGDGWQATVDGRPAPILPTDHALQGIPVDAGRHIVEVRYRPASLRIGLWVSAVSLVTMASALGWRAAVRLSRGQGALGSRPSSAATLVATASGSTTK